MRWSCPADREKTVSDRQRADSVCRQRADSVSDSDLS